MNRQMYDLAQWSIETAKAAGADDCRVSIDSERFVEIGYRERKPETIKEASTKGLDIQIYVNGRYSAQSTSDLRKDALKKFIGDAVAMTKLLAEDPFRTLPDPKYYEGRKDVDLGLVDPAYKNLT
ncbi:TldD/PmbA family protein, partial [candidate division KSB1 bacterium]|nr:TldD/PmbA family protein [candidate division KSB1 bacterium]